MSSRLSRRWPRSSRRTFKPWAINGKRWLTWPACCNWTIFRNSINLPSPRPPVCRCRRSVCCRTANLEVPVHCAYGRYAMSVQRGNSSLEKIGHLEKTGHVYLLKIVGGSPRSVSRLIQSSRLGSTFVAFYADTAPTPRNRQTTAQTVTTPGTIADFFHISIPMTLVVPALASGVTRLTLSCDSPREESRICFAGAFLLSSR